MLLLASVSTPPKSLTEEFGNWKDNHNVNLYFLTVHLIWPEKYIEEFQERPTNLDA